MCYTHKHTHQLKIPSYQGVDRDTYPVFIQHKTLSKNNSVSLVSVDDRGSINIQVHNLPSISTHGQRKTRMLFHSYQSVRMSQ